jgi:choline dehydrogenase-like flavoprotein
MNSHTPIPSLDEHVFSRFDEVAAREWDYVVIGAGCTGTITAHKILERRPGARLLLLEQGPYLLPDHVQNLRSVYQPLMSAATASPWQSDGDLEIVAQVPYLGGRTLFWSGSCPQPSLTQLRAWPAEVVSELAPEWTEARNLLGVHRASDLGREFDNLHRQLRHRIHSGAAGVAHVQLPESEEELDAELALALGGAGGTRKFSAVPLLMRTLASHPGTTALVTRCQALTLDYADDTVVAVETSEGTLPIHQAQVILALGTAEATGLVLRSFPRDVVPLAGTKLAGNTQSWFTCRLRRSEFSFLSQDHPDLAALYVDARTPDREFHFHISASSTTDPDRDTEDVYQLMPDVFGEGTVQRMCDPEHVILLVHGVAELAADGTAESPSRISTGADGVTVGTYRLGPSDRAVWDAMDTAAAELTALFAPGGKAEFWSPSEKRWTQTPPPERRMPFATNESGTLFMGGSPADSVTNTDGRLHNINNVYVTGGATHPARGSWNPTLTMTALCLRLARHLTTAAD